MEGQESLNLFHDEKKFMKGKHIVTIFHNEQNFYSVIKIKVEETNVPYDGKEAVITGYFPKIHEHETYVFFGQMKEHPKFGPQFNADHFRKEIPRTKDAVIAYLSGDLFKGIGKKTAEKIVDHLGENAISRILNNPSLLDSVPKLSPEKAKELYETLRENEGLEQAMIFLNQYGFGPQLSMRIYQMYRDETVEVIQSNPYRLVEDIEGIGFSRADELGKQLGITGSHPDRIKAACLYILQTECVQNGHVYTEAEHFLPEVKKLLEENGKEEIEYDLISKQILELEEEGKIVGEERRIYLPSLYYSEKGLVSNIKRILEQTEFEGQFPESEFLLALGKLEEKLNVQYSPSQKEAIQTALMSPMMILTGGPGTGKTTVIKGIVELYSELHGCSLRPEDYGKDEPFPFLLASPTGRAAKRMNEATGLPAVTIHRMLGWDGVDNFAYNEDNPLEGRILIVDETSMLDIWLAHQLFKALPDKIQVILVGDEDQLPSVGPGQVLKDLLQSGKIPSVALKEIYRQEEGSSIIDLAHEIKKGRLPENIAVPQKDRSFIQCRTGQIPEVVEKVVKSAKRKGYTAKDVQVLAPMYKGPAGIDQLNRILQEIFNGKEGRPRKEIKFGDVVYRVGDKVLQLVNQPEKNVFNGDIGEITSIFYAKENTDNEDMIVISFDENEVTYTKQDLNQITHAFCCSVHKSQGSEFPIVIFPVVKSYYRMLRRNLIYTAITRSKHSLVLCGEIEALQLGVERADEQKRLTTLKEKLVEAIGKKETPVQKPSPEQTSSISYEEKLMETDPMIGMENVTPYDFMES